MEISHFLTDVVLTAEPEVRRAVVEVKNIGATEMRVDEAIIAQDASLFQGRRNYMKRASHEVGEVLVPLFTRIIVKAKSTSFEIN